jgi:glycosyltransferase involved in cell wall biosynthesis
MSRPVVSIITPTHNHQCFIGQCIDSVLAQTYENWELIIVDDGSTDRTREIVQDYAEKDKRIKTFFQPNKGPRRLDETYNLALENSQGEWVAILEGDDYWFPQKLEVQLAAHTEQTTVSYGVYVDRLGERLQEGRYPPFEGTLPLRQFIPFLLLHQSFMIAVTVLIRKDALMTIGGFHQDGSPAAVDMATMMRLVQLPGEVVYIPQPLGAWRHHEGQSTNTQAVELAKFNTELVLRFYDTLPDPEKQTLGISRADIIRARRAQIADAYFGVLRQKLRQRKRKGVLELIAGTWRFGGMKRKAQAVYAVSAVAFGYDFEPILRFVQRVGFVQEVGR